MILIESWRNIWIKTADFTEAQEHFDSAEAYEFGAIAQTFTSIFDEANAPENIDLLSLDVEGAELAVLKGLDAEKYNFRYMLIETADIASITDHLIGYEVVDKLNHHDYLLAPKNG